MSVTIEPRNERNMKMRILFIEAKMFENEIAAFRKNAEDCQIRAHQAADRATRA